MGKFDKYAGKVKMVVDGDEYEVKPNNRQVAKLISLDKDKVRDEANFVGLTDCLCSIFTDAYPNEPKADIEGFVMKELDVIMIELVIGMGWATREDIDNAVLEEQGKPTGKENPVAEKKV